MRSLTVPAVLLDVLDFLKRLPAEATRAVLWMTIGSQVLPQCNPLMPHDALDVAPPPARCVPPDDPIGLTTRTD